MKKEQQKLEDERKRQEEEEQANPLDSLLGIATQTSATKKGAGVTPAKLMGKNIASILR